MNKSLQTIDRVETLTANNWNGTQGCHIGQIPISGLLGYEVLNKNFAAEPEITTERVGFRMYLVWRVYERHTTTEIPRPSFTLRLTILDSYVEPYPKEQVAPLTIKMVLADYTEEVFAGDYVGDVSLTNQMIADCSEISADVLSGYGEITLKDYNDHIYQLVMDEQISDSGQAVVVEYYGTTVGHYVVKSSTYDRDTRELKLSLTDELAEWDNIAFMDDINAVDGTNLVTPILEKVGYSESQVKSILNNNKIRIHNTDLTMSPYDYLLGLWYRSTGGNIKGGETNYTVRELIGYVCKLAQLCAYLNSNGELRFASVRPNEVIGTANDPSATKKQVWRINPQKAYSALNANLIVSNKVSYVSVTERNSDGSYSAQTPNSSTTGRKGKPFSITENNPFITWDCVYGASSSSPKMSKIIADNIEADYDLGVRSGEVEIGAFDYYDAMSNSLTAIKQNKGELLQLGDIVTFDKDVFGTADDIYRKDMPVYWEIRGRTFEYKGVAKLTLQLQELVYSTTEPLAGSAPVVTASVYEGSRYWRTYATVNWTPVRNPKSGADIVYELYVNGRLYTWGEGNETGQYTQPTSVVIETPKGTVNILVRAIDQSGTYVAMESNIVTVNIPTLNTYSLDYRIVSFPDDRRIVINGIPDANTYTLRAYDANENNPQKVVVASGTLGANAVEYKINLPREVSKLMTFEVTVHNNQFNMELVARQSAASKYEQTSIRLQARTDTSISSDWQNDSDERVIAADHTLMSNGIEPAILIQYGLRYGFNTATKLLSGTVSALYPDVQTGANDNYIISYPSLLVGTEWTESYSTQPSDGQAGFGIRNINSSTSGPFELKAYLNVACKPNNDPYITADAEVSLTVYYIGRG